MPTGYTAMIDEHPDMTTKQWVMEGLARAFGVCVSLREDGWGLTEVQVKQRIVKSGKHDITYHQKELAKAKVELSRFKRMRRSMKRCEKYEEIEKVGKI